MSSVELIPVRQLLLDEENPRLAVVQKGQDRALDAMARVQGTKLRYIAEDIVEHGLDPSYRLIVMPDKVLGGQFVVLDGNRRLSAIRALEDPEAVAGSVSARVLGVLRELSRRYQERPIDLVDCLVVSERDEADHWIELRHTGQHRGAGVVGWAGGEAGRFRARRSGRPDLATQALDILEEGGHLSPEARANVPASTLQRLLGTREVRPLIGVEVSDGQLALKADQDPTLLRRVADDLASGRVGVGELYTSQKRVAYAQDLAGVDSALEQNEEPRRVPDAKPSARQADITKDTPTTERESIATAGALSINVASRDPDSSAPHITTGPGFAEPPRKFLIPELHPMDVTNPRLRAIAHELTQMPLGRFPNSIAVLFRVFVELSADDYIERTPLSDVTVDSKLPAKLHAVTNHLVDTKQLTKQQAAPVRKAADAKSYEAIGTLLMNQWVHNRSMFPSEAELRAGWNNFEPWLSAVWPVATNAGSVSE